MKTTQATLEFRSLSDLFTFRQQIKVVTYKPSLKSLTITCELTNAQLAQAISLNAIPCFEEEDQGLMLSDHLRSSVFKNSYKTLKLPHRI